MSLEHPFTDLVDRTAVITGAARGIGLEIAGTLARIGMNLVLLDRDGDELETAVSTLQRDSGGIRIRGVAADLGHGDLSEVEAALADMPGLRVWVNNAGAVSHQRAEDTDPDTFEGLFRNNVTSALRASQVAFRHFSAVGASSGSIVNITSLVIDKVLPDRLSYSTSKAALLNVTRYCAQEWGPRGIRVNAISPGYIDSRLTRWAADDPRQIAKAKTVEGLALRRLGTAADIAHTVLYLSSNLASYVTGQVIHVDGGWHLT